MLNGKYVHSKQKHSKQFSKKQKQKQLANLAKLELDKQNGDMNDMETVIVNVQNMESIAKEKENNEKKEDISVSNENSEHNMNIDESILT